ncbi:hypothetical protein I4U23_008190 [Adineta vaga]|nr:hypothetical protein I4U23_008190 [Adineta vaga]
MNQTSRLIWMKNQNEIHLLAPWLFDSAIFCKKSENLPALLDTFKHHPIDALCASTADYELLNNNQQQRRIPTHLEQLFSMDSIDATTKAQWHSLTNLHLQDDGEKFNIESVVQPSVSKVEEKSSRIYNKYYLTSILMKKQLLIRKLCLSIFNISKSNDH